MFGITRCGLGQFIAPFGGERRQRHTDHLAFRLRIEPQIGFPNGAFHRLGKPLIPDLHSQKPRPRD